MRARSPRSVVIRSALRWCARLGWRLSNCEQQLARIADTGIRIADALDRLSPPPKVLPTDAYDELEVLRTSHDFGQTYEAELKLRKLLGRDPTPEEIVNELEGIES